MGDKDLIDFIKEELRIFRTSIHSDLKGVYKNISEIKSDVGILTSRFDDHVLKSSTVQKETHQNFILLCKIGLIAWIGLAVSVFGLSNKDFIYEIIRLLGGG